MTVQDLEMLLEHIAPSSLKIGSDPIGRCIGSRHRTITKIGVALDATPNVIAQCVAQGINALVTHHPLIYSPLSTLDEATGFPSNAVVAAIKADIAVLSAHTNWDCVAGGINDVLASVLGVTHCHPIEPSTGLTGACHGLGRIGRLHKPMHEDAFLTIVESQLSIPVRRSEQRDRMVQTIAVCGGAGESLYFSINEVADVYVTSDVRHHMFVASYGQPCTLWDAGHRETEVPGTKHLGVLLSSKADVPVIWLD